ncbi:hypothetical protein [Streptomyces althioticus]|uniref:hypothetical protein n=1 Tax=Streptomyces althioticus TaxID=83380 RepID=UPI0037F26589
MSGKRLPVAEPGDVRRATGGLARADRVLPPTAAGASASGVRDRLPDEPEHGHRTARGAGQDTHQGGPPMSAERLPVAEPAGVPGTVGELAETDAAVRDAERNVTQEVPR